ncbi:MAG: cysteine-rich small domain-containing protein [Defluviitaleaceae bacterium]|nr:cysteine-rich small domain-containing protein [Defluviitaleaceae bacterium]
MEASYKFYENKSCQFYPCHEKTGMDNFNCMFCFCPLYFLGDKCGGNFDRIGENGSIKDCSRCLIPHMPQSYEFIMKKIGDNIEQF